jgi:hypothetical protein
MSRKTIPARRFSRAVRFGAAGTVLITWAGLDAGPLNPPAGPVTSTFKTLGEVEPRIAINAENTPGDLDSVFRIEQPGSYYLTGPMVGVAGRSTIEIATSRVTIDLNGFSVEGVTDSQAGIRTSGPQFDVAIRNGSVRGFQDGIDFLNGGPGALFHIENIHASANAGVGIRVGANSTLRQCTSSGNFLGGFVIGEGSIVDSCIARANNLPGFQTESGCILTNCVSTRNGNHGFVVLGGGTLRNCIAYFNSGDGISATVSGTMTECVSRNNLSNGILAAGWRVERCTTSGNTLDGVRMTGSGAVLNCLSENNGPGVDVGAGIRVTGTDVRVEGNACNINDRGVQVDGAGNIVFRNTCSGNTTDWVFVANNVFGQIVDRRTPGSLAVNGFSATGTAGSTDPNANISH